MSDLLHREIAKLRGELDEANETIKQLRELIVPRAILPGWVPALSPTEEKVLRLLMAREMVSLDALYLALGPDKDTVYNMLRVYINKLRQKLGPHGVRIISDWGRGYHLDAASRERLSGAIAA